MVEAGTIIGRKRVDVFQANPPNPAELGIFAKLFSDITQGAGRRILRGKLGYARAAMYLNGEVPERSDDGELIATSAHIVKSGPGVLHDCNFNVWADGVRSAVTDPKEPLVILDGSLDEMVTVIFLSTTLNQTQGGTISLICDKAGSKIAHFRVRPMDRP